MRISLLIPTMDRPAFVVRALDYYAAAGFSGTIMLGDSSSPENQAVLQARISALAGRLHVDYQYFSPAENAGHAHILLALAERAATPYVVSAGDADLLAPRTLEAAADFLEQHPDYSAAHGRLLGFTLDGVTAHGGLRQVCALPSHHLTAEKAADRWRAGMRLASPTRHYLHRRDVWRQMYADAAQMPLHYLGEEMRPASFTLLLGKVAELDGLGLAFQISETRNFTWNVPSMYALTLQAGWTPAVHTLRNSVSAALIERDGLPAAETERIFDEALWRHLLVMLQSQYDDRYPPVNKFSILKKRFPWLARLGQAKPSRGPLTLRALRRPSHPYHADFKLIEAALTGRPVE